MNVTSITCYQCGVCGEARHTQAYAELCCKCSNKGCERMCAKNLPRCEECMEDFLAFARSLGSDAERKRFEAAKKVSWRDYPNAVYVDDGDRYFDSARDLIDHYTSDNRKLPEYCWGSTPMGPPCFDADDLLEWALADYDEDAAHRVDSEGLQKLLDAWCEKNDPGSYMVDTDTAVLLDGAVSEASDDSGLRS